MSGYGYAYRGSTPYNGLAPQTDNWNKTSYASDHVCKPVVVDAEGRKHPIVPYNTSHGTEAYVVKTETVVQEHVYSPFANGYNHSSHTKVEPLKDYGHVDDKWHKSSSPVHERRPYKVEEFLTKVQTEASQPRKFGLLNPSNWRQNPNSTGHHGHGDSGYVDHSRNGWDKPSGHHGHGDSGYVDHSGNGWDKPSGHHGHDDSGYVDHSRNGWDKPSGHHGHGDSGYVDYSRNGWDKPSVNTIRNGDYDDHYHNNHSRTEPTMVNTGGWARPSRTGWSAPPDTSLSKPTNNIGTAIEYLKEAAKPTTLTTSPGSRLTVPSTTGPKRDEYGQTIDSREASRRYGNFHSSSQPGETYTETIDSREAARRYRGTTV